MRQGVDTTGSSHVGQTDSTDRQPTTGKGGGLPGSPTPVLFPLSLTVLLFVSLFSLHHPVFACPPESPCPDPIVIDPAELPNVPQPAQWSVICKDAPYEADRAFSDAALLALQQAGWVERSSQEINAECARLTPQATAP